ncbi:MAG: hypothetical protein C4346_11565 [Chloroflexota bacterium]
MEEAAMPRRTIGPIAMFVVTSVIVLAGARALAQEPSASAHPLVGAWRISFPDDPTLPPSLYSFSDEGTVVGTNVEGTRIGSWKATGERTADMTVVGYATGPARVMAALVKVHAQIEVDTSGDHLTVRYTITVGEGARAHTSGPFTADGERIVVEPLPAVPGETPPAPQVTVMVPEATPAASPVATPVS